MNTPAARHFMSNSAVAVINVETKPRTRQDPQKVHENVIGEENERHQRTRRGRLPHD